MTPIFFSRIYICLSLEINEKILKEVTFFFIIVFHA